MLQVYHTSKRDDKGGGGFVDVAFFGDKPVGVLYEAQGGVCGFNFSFDVWEFGTGRNIVDKEFGPAPIDIGIYGLQGIDFSREHWQVGYIFSCWGCGVGRKH
jgi:hypothetical protein